MMIFIHILLNNVLPMSFMIGVGFVLQRIFHLDMKTLSKLNFYLFSPAMIFNLLYTTNISYTMAGQVILFFMLFMVAQYILVEIVIKLRGYQHGMKGAMRNSVLFYNSGNYGIPINQLAFSSNPYTLSVQILIMMMQSLIPNTYGVYSVNAHQANRKQIFKTIVSMPIIYIIPLAFLLRGFEIPLPGFVQTPVGYLANAFIGTALTTLGAQLGNIAWRIERKAIVDVSLATVLRLVGGPALAALIVWGMGLPSLMSAALIVSSAVPTSLSSVLLAVEFDNEQEFASQSVLITTVCSMITLTVVIFMLHL